MAEVAAFGYLVPMVVVLVAVALVVGLALTISFYLTISLSVYRSVVATRNEELRPDLQDQLLDRLFAENPGWEAWVADLSKSERRVVKSLLDENLRELDGQDAEQLRGLGDALGIPEQAAADLTARGEYTRLDALTWLTLLQRPEPYLESSFEPQTPRERAAVATLLKTTGELPDAATGVSFLLEGVDEQFTVFGQDTLYRVARDDPKPLLETASDAYTEWPEPLQTQVLAVCAHLETSIRDGSMEWLTAALETENDAIRAAAAVALGSFGWQASLRDQLFLERATDDPSPRVRADVYRMLAAWGDDEALSVLLSALVEERHPRALTVGTTALVGRQDRIDTHAAAILGEAWDWSAEHAAYDRLARTSGTEQVTN